MLEHDRNNRWLPDADLEADPLLGGGNTGDDD